MLNRDDGSMGFVFLTRSQFDGFCVTSTKPGDKGIQTATVEEAVAEVERRLPNPEEEEKCDVQSEG